MCQVMTSIIRAMDYQLVARTQHCLHACTRVLTRTIISFTDARAGHLATISVCARACVRLLLLGEPRRPPRSGCAPASKLDSAVVDGAGTASMHVTHEAVEGHTLYSAVVQ